MLDKVKKVSNRGNIAKNVGWHSINFNWDYNKMLFIPGRTQTIEELDRSTMITMTRIMNNLYKGIVPVPFSTNARRTKDWANELLKVGTSNSNLNEATIDNVFESITYAMTYISKNETGTMLNMHIDHFNGKLIFLFGKI